MIQNLIRRSLRSSHKNSKKCGKTRGTLGKIHTPRKRKVSLSFIVLIILDT